MDPEKLRSLIASRAPAVAEELTDLQLVWMLDNGWCTVDTLGAATLELLTAELNALKQGQAAAVIQAFQREQLMR